MPQEFVVTHHHTESHANAVHPGLLVLSIEITALDEYSFDYGVSRRACAGHTAHRHHVS